MGPTEVDMKSSTWTGALSRIFKGIAVGLVLAPMIAQATEIRDVRTAGATTQSLVYQLLAVGSSTDRYRIREAAFVARFKNGQLIQHHDNYLGLEALSPNVLAAVVQNGWCEIQGSGPCLVAEGQKIAIISVKRYHEGTVDVLQGAYIRRAIEASTDLAGSANQLLAIGQGRSIIYSNGGWGPIFAPQPPVYQPPVYQPPVYQPAPQASELVGYCGIEATMDGQSLHLGVGFSESVGKGVISCTHFDGSVERLPVKIVMQGLGVGAGLTFGIRYGLVATGIGATQGARGLLGTYGIASVGAHALALGADVGVGFTATRGALAIPFGIRGKVGPGLEVAGDVSGLTITEDDGAPAVLPPREDGLPSHDSYR